MIPLGDVNAWQHTSHNKLFDNIWITYARIKILYGDR